MLTSKTGFLPIIDNVNEWSGRLLMWGMIPITLLIFSEVILRYFFNAPTVWSAELSSYLFGALSILGGGYVAHIDAHVRMDIFRSRLSPRGRALLDTFTSILTFVFCFILIWMGLFNALDATALKETSGTTWDPPYWPYTWMIPVGVFLLLLQCVATLIRDIRVILIEREM